MKRSLLILIIFQLSIVKIFSQNIDLLGHLPFDYRLSNIWSYESNARQYALIGTEEGFAVVDITNPNTPTLVDTVLGTTNIWREVKVWQDRAYVVSEADDGLLIVNLSYLPDSITYQFTDCNVGLTSAHTLHVDEFGYLYLYGTNLLPNQNTQIFDLNSNPDQPIYHVIYDLQYIHDGEVRNNKIYASEIYNGTATIIDVSNKANPIVIGNIETPSSFTHNTWLSDDDQTMFTTDERVAAYVASYDISDPTDIQELDRWKNFDGSASIPHNVYVKNDYLVLSAYREGVYIIDAHEPDNLITVGHFDTSPFNNGGAFNGAWGVCPYFSDDKIVVSDIETGLYILDVTYTRACYLRGNITQNGIEPLIGASCEIIGKPESKRYSSFDGKYKTGLVDSGLVDVRFFNSNCVSKIIPNVNLQKGITTTLNVDLTCEVVITDINDSDKKSIAVYPTLIKDEITIYNPDADRMEIQIINANGQVMKNLNSETEYTILSMNGFDNGNYFIQAKNKSQSFSRQIVLVK